MASDQEHSWEGPDPGLQRCTRCGAERLLVDEESPNPLNPAAAPMRTRGEIGPAGRCIPKAADGGAQVAEAATLGAGLGGDPGVGPADPSPDHVMAPAAAAADEEPRIATPSSERCPICMKRGRPEGHGDIAAAQANDFCWCDREPQIAKFMERAHTDALKVAGAMNDLARRRIGVDPACGRDETVLMTLARCATCSGEGVICFEVGRDEYGDVVTDTEECETCHGSGMTAEQAPTEESVHRAVAETLKRPEDNFIPPTELLNRAQALGPEAPAPTLPSGRVLDQRAAAKLPRRAAPATTVEAYNREPAFAEPAQIPKADIDPGSRRRSRLPAYQREGKRARAVGRAMLRQIEADKRKAAKRAERERREHEARERALDDAAIPASALDMIDFTGPNPLEE